ncbi:MAG: hypothetical protein ACTSQP_04320 [Promethearchaeota archaeon]
MIIEVTLGIIQYLELSLWIVSIFFLTFAGIWFSREYKRTKNILFFWVGPFFFLFIIARIFRLLVRFYIGEPKPGEPLIGDAFILESIYTIVSYIGLFCIYFALEKTYIRKTKFFFSILVWIITILSIIDFITRNLLWITLPLFILTVLALPIIFFILAAKSSGQVRKNSIIVAIGIIFFILGIAFDIPEGRILFIGLGELFLATIPPIFQIIACILIWEGFRKRV